MTRARLSGSVQLEAQSLNLLARAAWRRFEYDTVIKWANEALDVLRVVGDPADRMFILEDGQVSLIDPRRKTHLPAQLTSGDGFGAMAFLTDCPYSVSAVATKKRAAGALPRQAGRRADSIRCIV